MQLTPNRLCQFLCAACVLWIGYVLFRPVSVYDPIHEAGDMRQDIMRAVAEAIEDSNGRISPAAVESTSQRLQIRYGVRAKQMFVINERVLGKSIRDLSDESVVANALTWFYTEEKGFGITAREIRESMDGSQH